MVSQNISKKQGESHSHQSLVSSALAATAGVVIGLVIGNFLGLV
jgi:hypothetical protein